MVKNALRSCPLILLLRAMKSFVVTLQYLLLAYHVLISLKNDSPPILTRSACSVIAPRLYTLLPKICAPSPGTAVGGLQMLLVSGRAYRASNAVWALSPPCCSVQIHSDQVAKPSFSQMSGQLVKVTASPNH